MIRTSFTRFNPDGSIQLAFLSHIDRIAMEDIRPAGSSGATFGSLTSLTFNMQMDVTIGLASRHSKQVYQSVTGGCWKGCSGFCQHKPAVEKLLLTLAAIESRLLAFSPNNIHHLFHPAL